MVQRSTIPAKTLRLLYAHSGNCCAFEGCNCPIFEDDGTLTGECCHIESYSPDGPRYNKRQTDEDRNGYDNLMLMCARHHKIIDSHPEQYSVKKLKSIKKSHENRYLAQQLEKYWSTLKLIDATDDTGFKIELGENDMDSLMKDIKRLYEGLQDSIDSITESSQNLQNDLKIECEECDIDYYLFDKILYDNNSLVNRDWETINLSFPNQMTMLRTRYLQLCVNFLEKLAVYNQNYVNMLNKCKKMLTRLHKSAYYVD